MDQDVLHIEVVDDGDVTVVRLTGELDALNVEDLTAAVDRLLIQGRKLLVIDLSGLDFIDSAGLGGLVRLWESSVERGSFLALGSPSARVRDVLQITGLNSVLKSFDTMPQALDGVRSMEEAFPDRSSTPAA